MQVHVSPGQTESQVAPSFQLASTCDSIWPGLETELKFSTPFLASQACEKSSCQTEKTSNGKTAS